MEYKEFDKLVNETLKGCKDLLAIRKHDYARGGDRLHNFKRAAAFEQVTPEKALVGMWVKQLVSILDMVDDLDEGIIMFDEWDERIHDAINYLLLLKALIVERND